MTDIDSVNNVVKHVHKLRNDRRHSQLKQQPADRFRAEKSLFLPRRRVRIDCRVFFAG